MYREYFGLKENPFSISPDPHYFYMSEGHREAMAHLVYGIKSEGGFVLLTGEVGTGKTTVCRCVLEQMPDDAEIAFILNPRLTVEELLANICDEFGINYAPDNKSNRVFVSLINDYLLDAHTRGKRAILIIEEAQNLSVEVLEQIRLLTNLETNQRKLLQIIMLGQPELRDILSRPELRQLSQRITARYHLGPLSKAEVSAYVDHRLSVAGLIRGRLFPEKTLRRLYRLTGGVPRLINVICDRALTGAYVQGKEQVDTKTLITAAQEVSGENTTRRPRVRIYQAICAAVVLLLCVAGVYYVQKSRVPATIQSAQVFAKPPAAGKAPTEGTPAPQVVTLQKPANATRVSTKDKAYQTLFSRWQVAYDPKSRRGPCEQAESQGLHCLEEKGSLTNLRQMNRPAVLKLGNGKGEYYATLLSLNEDTASFAVEDETRSVDIKEIARKWSGEYVLLWRGPPGHNGKLKPGNRGPAVAWLDQKLSRIQGRKPSPEKRPLYDEKLENRVKEFQAAAGLVPDGIAGIRTVICVTDAARDSGPVLRGQKGSN
jgi:general secretion pathway protein A